MKTLQEQIETVKIIAGTQHFLPHERYRASCFCLETECQDGRLLYNTLTGEMLLLDSTETKDEAIIHEHLVHHWFMVPRAFDETKHCDQIRYVAQRMQRRKKAISHYVIFTTTDCNARCFYCFEKGQRRISMSEKTALDVANYILANANGEKIKIRWFGGEPLVNSKVIDLISEELQKHGAEYESSIVTNAYLFDETITKRAKDLWHLKRVLITIDGTEQVYNRTKAYVYRDKNAYHRVMDNIDGILQAGIAVTVNLNMDASNAQDLFLLANELRERFQDKKLFFARGALLTEYVGKIKSFDSTQTALDTLQALDERLMSYNFWQRSFLSKGMRLNACMADDPNSAVILPDGRIGRCEHFGDREDVGSIYEDSWNTEKLSSWKALRSSEELCKTCAIYPMCLRLKKCNACPEQCDELYQGIRLMDIRLRMQNVYKKWKADPNVGSKGN